VKCKPKTLLRYGSKQTARGLPLFEIARVVVRLDHVAHFIVNANHGIVWGAAFDWQQQVSCVFLLNSQTNFPSFTEQQHDEVTSLPVSLQISVAANAGDATIAVAINPNNACFIRSPSLERQTYVSSTKDSIKLSQSWPHGSKSEIRSTPRLSLRGRTS
jgi:hypothetical protein